jgi:membrane protein DedA with SNARE-associated domain
VIEGPIVTVIAAFLASRGVLNIYTVYSLAVCGDLIGDTLYYWLGRTGSYAFLLRRGWFGITAEKLQKTHKLYSRNLWKAMTVIKVTQAPILPVILVMGAAKVDFKRFLLASLVVTLPKILLFALLGFYFGKYYESISRFLDIYALIFSVIAIVGILIYLRRKKRV